MPAGNTFHAVSRLLLPPTALLSSALQRYQAKAERCLVGVHMRTRKPYPNQPEAYIVPQQYVAAVRSIAQNLPGRVFLASDGQQVFQQMAGLLPERDMWWTN